MDEIWRQENPIQEVSCASFPVASCRLEDSIKLKPYSAMLALSSSLSILLLSNLEKSHPAFHSHLNHVQVKGLRIATLHFPPFSCTNKGPIIAGEGAFRYVTYSVKCTLLGKRGVPWCGWLIRGRGNVFFFFFFFLLKSRLQSHFVVVICGVLAGQPGAARAFALRAELCSSFLASRSLNPEMNCSSMRKIAFLWNVLALQAGAYL